MSKTSILILSLLFLALLPLSGCEEEPCNACKAADCPERPLNGAYAPWLQISRDDCDLSWNDGQAVLDITQDLMNAGENNEWTQLTMTITQVFYSVSVRGALCQTEDTDSPKSYRFSGSHSSGSMDDQENTVIAGEFVVGTEKVNFCGSMTFINTVRDDQGNFESCSMSAAIYTNEECCQDKKSCK